METTIINQVGAEAYRAAVSEAAAALREGAVVIFPTETVYGIGAAATHPEAVQRLRAAKSRADQPFTVHIGEPADARKYVRETSNVFRRLARKGWPGPLSLVAPVDDPQETPIAREVPAERLGDIFYNDSVGLRCPDHPASRQLLSEAGVPIIASSANPAGRTPPNDFNAAMDAIGNHADFAIDGGATRFRGSSTIVEVRGEAWQLLRDGVIEERIIHRMTRSEVLMVCTGNSCRSPLAEYIFRQKLATALEVPVEQLEDRGYAVRSAGTFAPVGGPISEGSNQELAKRQIEGAQHRSQPLTPELAYQADRIYVMTPEHREMVLDLAPGAARRVELLDPEGPISDPIGAGPDAYAQCAGQIERVVEQRVEEFLHEDRNW